MAAGTETPDAEATRRTQISTKRPDPVVPNEGAQKVANLEQTLASVDVGNRVRSTGERARTSETHTEMNPETLWSSDLGWVPKSILQEARGKEVTNLQQFDTSEKVPQADAEGQEIISSLGN